MDVFSGGKKFKMELKLSNGGDICIELQLVFINIKERNLDKMGVLEIFEDVTFRSWYKKRAGFNHYLSRAIWKGSQYLSFKLKAKCLLNE